MRNGLRVKMWLRWLICTWQARRWLRAGDPDRIAADCLFVLNRIARQCGRSHAASCVYALKGLAIRYWHDRGFCLDIAQQRQDLECWQCGGTGRAEPRWEINSGCWKCGGTGVYASHLLYRFIFSIGGRRYIWHQPKNVLDWEPRSDLVRIGGRYERGISRHIESDLWEIRELYYATLYAYLAQRGYRPPAHSDARPRLRESLRNDWRTWLIDRRWWRRWNTTHYRIKTLVAAVRRYLDTGTWVMEEEIPF